MSRRSRAEVVMTHHDGPGAKSGPEGRLQSVFLEASLEIVLCDPQGGLLDASPSSLEPVGAEVDFDRFRGEGNVANRRTGRRSQGAWL